MDIDVLEKNIEKATIEGNLSLKQIDTIKETHCKHHRKDRNINTSIIQKIFTKINQDEYFDIEYKVGKHSERIHRANNSTKKTPFLFY